MTFEITMIPLQQLRRAPWNANVVPAAVLEKVKQSIVTFGVVQNLVVRALPRDILADQLDHLHYETIGGNHRLDLYRELKINPAPCMIVDVDDARARLLSEALNQVHGKDDPALYQQLLSDIVTLGTPTDDITRLLNESEDSLKKLLNAGAPPTDPPLNWQGRYEIVIECADETEQRDLYNQLTTDGHTCRVLTM